MAVENGPDPRKVFMSSVPFLRDPGEATEALREVSGYWTDAGDLDPGFAEVRKPYLLASSLPPLCYSDASWFAAEVTSIFSSTWLFVGRDQFVGDKGSYLTCEILGRPIIVVRDKFEQLKAYMNSCRHRGSRLLDGAGKVSSIRCPFHSWNYGLDGCLIGAPGSAGLLDFDKSAVRLDEVRCESSGGFVFICFDVGAPSLIEYLGDFVDRVIGPYRTENMHCIHRRQYTLASNWKTYVEVDMETLHTEFIHNDSIGAQPVTVPSTSTNWVTVVNDSDYSPALFPKDRGLGFPPMNHLPRELTTKTHFSVALPGFFIITAPDCMWWINKIPLNATETAVDVGYCFPAHYVDRADFAEISARYVRRWDQVIHEDDIFTEYQQRGLVGARPGRYADCEEAVHRVDNWVLDRVFGRGVPR